MSHVLTTPAGTVTVTDGVLLGIAVRAVEGGGVRVRRRRAIDLDAGVVRLSVAVPRGEPILELGERAQEDVAEALRTMCGLEARVDLHVGELA